MLFSVDCTSDESQGTCSKNGIEGFPTLMYGDPDFLESYDGSREFDELYVFATSGNLKASCSPKNIHLCDDEEKAKMEELIAMSIEDLKNAVKEIDDKMAKAEDDFDASTEVLEEEYMKMTEMNKKVKDEVKEAHHYNILKGVQSLKAQAVNDKDEL